MTTLAVEIGTVIQTEINVLKLKEENYAYSKRVLGNHKSSRMLGTKVRKLIQEEEWDKTKKVFTFIYSWALSN